MLLPTFWTQKLREANPQWQPVWYLALHPQLDECTQVDSWFCPCSIADKAPIPGKGNWDQGSLGHTTVLCTLWESITRLFTHHREGWICINKTKIQCYMEEFPLPFILNQGKLAWIYPRNPSSTHLSLQSSAAVTLNIFWPLHFKQFLGSEKHRAKSDEKFRWFQGLLLWEAPNRNFPTDSLKLGPKLKCKKLLRKHEVTAHPHLSFYKISSVSRKSCLPFLMMDMTKV